MDDIIAFLQPFVQLFVEGTIVILVFLFVVKPVLNYFIVNREIEHRKKLAREYQEAKREAEAIRKSKRSDDDNVFLANRDGENPSPAAPEAAPKEEAPQVDSTAVQQEEPAA